jgi:hypothetical protein
MALSHVVIRFQLALFWSTKPSFPVSISRKKLNAGAVEPSSSSSWPE